MQASGPIIPIISSCFCSSRIESWCRIGDSSWFRFFCVVTAPSVCLLILFSLRSDSSFDPSFWSRKGYILLVFVSSLFCPFRLTPRSLRLSVFKRIRIFKSAAFRASRIGNQNASSIIVRLAGL